MCLVISAMIVPSTHTDFYEVITIYPGEESCFGSEWAEAQTNDVEVKKKVFFFEIFGVASKLRVVQFPIGTSSSISEKICHRSLIDDDIEKISTDDSNVCIWILNRPLQKKSSCFVSGHYTDMDQWQKFVIDSSNLFQKHSDPLH